MGELVLDYVEQGDPSGVPFLLLHGFADSWLSCTRVLPHLPSTLHALAPTQRGHGASGRPATGYSVRDFARDARAFMDALGLGAAVLVGHSMGSAVATRFAIDHPDRTRGLVLVGASSGLAASDAAREQWDATLATLTDPVDEQLVRKMTEGALVQPVPRAFVDEAVREGTKVPPHVWRATFASRWNREGDFSEKLASIQVPTLIVWGDRDVRYSRADQQALASAIPHARLLVYEGAGTCSTGRSLSASPPISCRSPIVSVEAVISPSSGVEPPERVE